MIANSDPFTCGGGHYKTEGSIFYNTAGIQSNVSEELI
jgi:hypothetical protein